MPPQASDGFKPKYRHFHPQSTVWVQNILEHDVVYQVADEHNTPFQYRLPAGKVSELPGGPVATLGVKAIVDELIQNTKEDVLRIWTEEVRSKHEAKVIVREKSAPLRSEQQNSGGEIDLSVKSKDIPEVDTPTAPKVEQAFPDAKKAKANVNDIANASLGNLKTATLLKDE